MRNRSGYCNREWQVTLNWFVKWCAGFAGLFRTQTVPNIRNEVERLIRSKRESATNPLPLFAQNYALRLSEFVRKAYATSYLSEKFVLIL